MILRPTIRPLLLGATLLLATHIPLAAQDVQKPRATGGTLERLPAPVGVTVRQTGPTQITLTWGAVDGAKSYVLGRSVGTEGFRRVVDAPTGPETMYVDNQARPGVRHSYTVTAVNQSDVAGLRATSESIVPTQAIVQEPTAPIPMKVTASLIAPDAISVSWGSPGPNTLYYAVTHWLNEQVRENIGRTDVPSLTRRDLPPGAHRFQVNAVGKDMGNMGVASSNVITIAAPPVSPAVTTSAADATAAVLVSVAAPVSVRVGGTTSVGSGQWTSLNTGVATVASDGSVTGRAAGTAQVVSLGLGSDGAIRVTVVRVVVQP